MRPKHHTVLIALILLSSVACEAVFGSGPSEEELRAVDYSPLELDDWENSTPEAEGIDPLAVAQLFSRAAELETIYGLLVVRNGRLIAEDYWHGSGSWHDSDVQSVTKSFTGALVGLAIAQGYIESVDQPMTDFFPELVDQVRDPRKMDITVRHLLQMRAGYPWEESSPELYQKLFYEGLHPDDLVNVPLIRDPGTDHDYSNLSSHLLGMIVTRATGMDLLAYAQRYLFAPLNTEARDWQWQWDDYRDAMGGLMLTGRNMARFGQLYLDGGSYGGEQIIPADWVEDSLATYSEDAWDHRIGRNVRNMGYGYQWWSIRCGDHRCNLAWGHGGQVIMIVPSLNLVVVVKADPFNDQSSYSWEAERANINLAADFVAGLR
jgi:CubicO group peptidase (beta-lactamase class C family)